MWIISQFQNHFLPRFAPLLKSSLTSCPWKISSPLLLPKNWTHQRQPPLNASLPLQPHPWVRTSHTSLFRAARESPDHPPGNHIHLCAGSQPPPPYQGNTPSLHQSCPPGVFLSLRSGLPILQKSEWTYKQQGALLVPVSLANSLSFPWAPNCDSPTCPHHFIPNLPNLTSHSSCCLPSTKTAPTKIPEPNRY